MNATFVWTIGDAIGAAVTSAMILVFAGFLILTAVDNAILSLTQKWRRWRGA